MHVCTFVCDKLSLLQGSACVHMNKLLLLRGDARMFVCVLVNKYAHCHVYGVMHLCVLVNKAYARSHCWEAKHVLFFVCSYEPGVCSLSLL